MKLYDIDRFLQRRGPPQVSLEQWVLGKWGGRINYDQLFADLIICSGRRVNPDVRIINELFIVNSAAVIGRRNTNPHLPKAAAVGGKLSDTLNKKLIN